MIANNESQGLGNLRSARDIYIEMLGKENDEWYDMDRIKKFNNNVENNCVKYLTQMMKYSR